MMKDERYTQFQIGNSNRFNIHGMIWLGKCSGIQSKLDIIFSICVDVFVSSIKCVFMNYDHGAHFSVTRI